MCIHIYIGITAWLSPGTYVCIQTYIYIYIYIWCCTIDCVCVRMRMLLSLIWVRAVDGCVCWCYQTWPILDLATSEHNPWCCILWPSRLKRYNLCFVHWTSQDYEKPCLHAYIRKYIHTVWYLTYIHTCIHTYICASMRTYTHTYIHAYMYTCIHAYMH